MTPSALPMPAHHSYPTRYSRGTETHPHNKNTGQGRPNHEAPIMQFPAKSKAVADLRCPEVSQRRICDLIWTAFPGRSAHAVSQRAGLVMGRDPRTVRSWMAGETTPNWREVGIIAAYAGIDKAMQILFGAR